MNIQHDLYIGQCGENQVVELLEALGVICTRNTKRGQLLYYDIQCQYQNLVFTIEIKNDLMAQKTGNIAIEIFNSKKLSKSGVQATRANLWAHIINNKVWLTSVAKLKHYIDTMPPHRIIENGGDNNATLLLYKIDNIVPDIFISLHKATQDNLYNILQMLGIKND